MKSTIQYFVSVMLVLLLTSLYARADQIPIDPSKITLDPTVGSGSPFKPSSGDPSKLADEQNTVGNPLTGAGADLYTACGGSFYSCTWASNTGGHLNGAIIDLGANYKIDRIYIYDTNGKAVDAGLGNFTVTAGSPTEGWSTELVSDDLGYYRTWKGFPNDTANDIKGRVDDPTLFFKGVTTRYLRVINPIAGMQELVVYGVPAVTTPPSSTIHTGTQVVRSYGTGTGSIQDFLEYLPADFATSGKDYPIVFFFHGSGECGTDINKLIKASGSVPNMLPSSIYPLGKLPKGLLPLPEDAIVISPHLQLNASGGCSWNSSITIPFVNWLLAQSPYKSRIDLKRVYLTGLSLGGGAVLSFASKYPLDVAAIAVASGVSGDQPIAPIAQVPAWFYNNAYHNVNPVPMGTTFGQLKGIVGSGPPMGTALPQDGKSHTVSFDLVSRKWEAYTLGEAAPFAGELTTFTALPGTGHDSWSAMYKNALMWNWLFKQSR